jgi:hypothetical protein
MFRLIALVLLALLPACSSVTRTQPQAASTPANQPPPDCAVYEPDTPEKQKCLEQTQPVSKGVATAVFAGGMAAILVGGLAFALSDENAKADIVRIGTLDNGLPLYRFRYSGSRQQFVGVIAQEARAKFPDAVSRFADGYLHVDYGMLGIRPMTWEVWQTGGYVYPPRRSGTAVASLAIAQ